MLNRGVSGAKELAEWFSNLDKGQWDVILTVGIAVAAFCPLLLVTGKFTQSVAGAITAFAAIRAQMIAYQAANEGATASQALFNATLTANPVGAIATAICADTTCTINSVRPITSGAMIWTRLSSHTFARSRLSLKNTRMIS